MNNEIELLEFLKGYSNKNNLNLSFEELLRLFNEQKLQSITTYIVRYFLIKKKALNSLTNSVSIFRTTRKTKL